MTARRTAAVVLSAVVLLSGCSAAGSEQPQPSGAVAVTASPVEQALAVTRRTPGNPAAWSSLALVALEAGRASGDPALYAQAREAAQRSLTVQPQDNDVALAAQAMLAAADHDFAGARTLAERALAVNPRSVTALSALTDALTGLGRLEEARAAAQRLDATDPGVASFTRLSYQAELRGDLDTARTLMDRAAEVAGSAGELAFARAQGGLLALTAGDVAGAQEQLRLGAAAAPGDTSLTHLTARIAVQRNDLTTAAGLYTDLVGRQANPAFAAEQADVLLALGDRPGAERALALARAGYALQAGAGVRPEGTQVLFEADHGDPAAAVALGREVVRRSPTADHADALAWALHRAGQDQEALRWSEKALASGARTPAYRSHHAAIQAGLR